MAGDRRKERLSIIVRSGTVTKRRAFQIRPKSTTEDSHWGGNMPRLLAACAAALFAMATSAFAQESALERGRYLVDAVMGCDGCHTPRPKGQFNYDKRFSGGSQVWDTPAY